MSANDIMSLEDQARIELTLKTRENIIRQLTKTGAVPADVADRAILMQALDGMDRTVLTKAKIKSDDSNAKTQSDNAKQIAELLMRVDSKKVNNGSIVDVEATVLPSIDVVEGETFIGVQTFKYNDIMGEEA